MTIARCLPQARRGFTMIELMIASAIMASLVLALGIMSDAVYRGSEHCEGYGLAVQHARVVRERIARRVSTATANELFPGVLVVSETVDNETFPDTLVVWATGDPLDVNGDPRLPMVHELVIYTTSAANPNELIEIEYPSGNADVPEFDDDAAWRTLIGTLKAGAAENDEEVLLTDLLRVVEVRTADAGSRRAALRFVLRVTPSVAQWNEFPDTRDWEALDWPQGVYGVNFGLRQSWVRFEMQLTPGREVVANNSGTMPAMPFFGSAALYYVLQPN